MIKIDMYIVIPSGIVELIFCLGIKPMTCLIIDFANLINEFAFLMIDLLHHHLSCVHYMESSVLNNFFVDIYW